MDRVTHRLFKDWIDNSGLGSEDEAEQFEFFVNFVVLSRQHEQQFSVDEYSCGAGGTVGIDGFALSINGELIPGIDELEDALQGKHSFDSAITIIQVKRTDGFNLGDMSVFADTAVAMLKNDKPPHPGLVEAHSMLQMLFDHSPRFRSNPVCKLFYVTTGNWKEQAPFLAKIKDTKDRLESTNLLSRVDFHVWGAKQIQDNWRAIDSATEVTFQFDQKTTLPDMSGIREAYIGVIPATEFVKLIVDEDGDIRKTLFFDNVRDFQGDNDVNLDIGRTLLSGEASHFCVLNNGVTTVAEDLKVTGNRFTLRDFQIVNGCQTSHILHRHRDRLDDVYVPFRLIVSDDEDVTNSITKATNKQSQVTAENLLALAEVQKRIEAYFNSFGDDDAHRIYYERRSKQWAGSTQVRGTWRVITLRNLMQSFSSMYLRIPHTAARYYGDLRKRAGTEVFADAHHPSYYYSAAYAFCKMDHFFRSGAIDRGFKPVRYHLLTGIQTVVSGNPEPDKLESLEKKAEKSCAALNKLLWDEKAYLESIHCAAEIIERLAGARGIDRELGRNRDFTDQYMRALLEAGQ
ncbi:AIPR family protein [Nocardia xishanensis]